MKINLLIQANMDQKYYLELCSNPIRFDSVSQLTTVFFDDANKQVRTLISTVNTFDDPSITFSCLLCDRAGRLGLQ